MTTISAEYMDKFRSNMLSNMTHQGLGNVSEHVEDEDDVIDMIKREKAQDPNDDSDPADISDEVWESEQFQNQLHEYIVSQSGPKLSTAGTARNCQYVRPVKGFVFKTKDREGNKYFINVCGSTMVPKPPEITQDILSGDNPQVRIPLSLAAARDDHDRSGAPCKVFDAIIHSDVVAKTEKEKDMKGFVVELCLQWVEQKHKLELSRAVAFPKGMKSKGEPDIQTIRLNTNALVTPVGGYRNEEVEGDTARAEPSGEVEPEYQVEVEAATVYRGAHVEVVVSMPKLATGDDVILDHSSTRLFLKAKGAYRCTISLPHALAKAGADAEFDTHTRTLTVRLQIATAATDLAEKGAGKQAGETKSVQPRNTLAMELD